MGRFSRFAFFRAPRIRASSNTWGVWMARSVSRGIVSPTKPLFSDLMVSFTGIPGTAAPKLWAARTVLSMRGWDTSGLAPS